MLTKSLTCWPKTTFLSTSLGQIQRGRDMMREGWRCYFALPDYWVAHD